MEPERASEEFASKIHELCDKLPRLGAFDCRDFKSAWYIQMSLHVDVTNPSLARSGSIGSL